MDVTILDFLEYLKNQKKASQNTLDSYKRDILKFKDYLKEERLTLRTLKSEDLEVFLDCLEQDGLSLSTISRIYSSLRSYFDFLFYEGKLSQNPMKFMKKPKAKPNASEILTLEEVESILAGPKGNEPRELRDKAILETLYGTGLKISELSKLEINDVNLNMEFINCSGSRRRVIPITQKIIDSLKKYILEARPKILSGKENNILFLNLKGEALTRQGLWKIITGYGGLLESDKNITPTIIRKSFASHMIQNGVDLKTVSNLLGNIGTIEGLTKEVTSVLLREEIQKKHPRLK